MSGFEEPSHGVVGASGVVTMGLGEMVETSLDAHDGDGEAGQVGEVAWEMAGAHPALVFAVGDIAHVMEPAFDAPVSPHELQDRFESGPLGRERGQAMDGLVLDLSGGADAPLAYAWRGRGRSRHARRDEELRGEIRAIQPRDMVLAAVAVNGLIAAALDALCSHLPIGPAGRRLGIQRASPPRSA